MNIGSTSFAPLISNTSKFNVIKISQIFTTQRWIRKLFLLSLHSLKLDQQNYKYRKAFSALPQSVALLLRWSTWEAELPTTHCSKNLPWRRNKHPVNLALLWLSLLQSCTELLRDHLLCTLITDISSLTSGSKCKKAESISFDPFPLDYRIICLASEYVMNYREGTW